MVLDWDSEVQIEGLSKGYRTQYLLYVLKRRKGSKTQRSKTHAVDVGKKTARLKWDWADYIGPSKGEITQWVPQDDHLSARQAEAEMD